jgi:hypothetical protein
MNGIEVTDSQIIYSGIIGGPCAWYARKYLTVGSRMRNSGYRKVVSHDVLQLSIL